MISSSNVSNDTIFYNLQQTGSTAVLMRLTSNEFTEISTLPQFSSDDIPRNILLYNNEIKLFIPGCKLVCMYTM